MKNTIKLFGFIALIAVIGFSMAACNDKGCDKCSVHMDGSGKMIFSTVTFCEKANCIVNVIRTSPEGSSMPQYANQTVTCKCN